MKKNKNILSNSTELDLNSYKLLKQYEKDTKKYQEIIQVRTFNFVLKNIEIIIKHHKNEAGYRIFESVSDFIRVSINKEIIRIMPTLKIKSGRPRKKPKTK